MLIVSRFQPGIDGRTLVIAQSDPRSPAGSTTGVMPVGTLPRGGS